MACKDDPSLLLSENKRTNQPVYVMYSLSLRKMERKATTLSKWVSLVCCYVFPLFFAYLFPELSIMTNGLVKRVIFAL